MYAQQYRQTPKDYGGTSMKEPVAAPAPCEEDTLFKRYISVNILIAVIIFIVMSGGWEKNALVLMALVFILL